MNSPKKFSFVRRLFGGSSSWLSEGHRRLRMGQNRAAIEAFTQFLKEVDKYPLAHSHRAFANLQLIELDPRFCTSLTLIEYEDWMDEILRFALNDINTVIESSDTFAHSEYLKHGRIYFLREEYNAAIAQYSLAIEHQELIENAKSVPFLGITGNKRSIAYINRAEVYIKLGEIEKAISDLNQARKFDPVDPDVYYYLGEAYLAQKKYEIAFSYFYEATKMRTGMIDAMYGAGKALIGLHRYQEAYKFLKIVILTTNSIRLQNETIKELKNIRDKIILT